MNSVFFGIGKTCPLFLLLWTILCLNFQPLLAQPNGFSDELIIDGWSQAVGLTFDDNGRMYVWEKGGKVWIVENGQKSAQPLIDISEEVGNWRDFGLIGFALDPNFLNNGSIYLWYVVDRHHLMNFGTPNYNPIASSEKEATIARLTRYTANANNNFNTVNNNSRKILIGETKATGPPILHESHGAGHIVFGTDGTLMVSVGDGASYASPVDEGSHPATYFQQALADGIITPEQNIGAYRCQSLNNLSGKILRIDPNTGNGVLSNPFYQSFNPRSPQSRTWSLGIRNPYRMAIKPESGSHNAQDGNPGTFFFGDVGWSTWEDLNVADTPGQNFGWPIYEGISQKAGYNNPNFAVSDAEHEHPKVDWRHGADQARVYVNGRMTSIGSGVVSGRQFRGNSSTGGVWYTGTDFPEAYRNTYFHADYSGGWIRNFGFDEQNNPTFVKDFKLDAGAVVFLNTSSIENGLFYVRYPNQIRRIIYTGNANKKPVALIKADRTYGTSPLTVKFDASQSYDPEFSPLTYQWDFGNNNTSTSSNPTVVFETSSAIPTTYPVTLTVRDEYGATTEQTIPISLNNTPPVIVSTSIDNRSSFSAQNGASINLNAVVTDAEHNGQLKFKWQTALFHNGHSHAEPIDNNPSTTTSLSPIECDGSTYWFRITLKVTDPKGLFTTYQKDIFPDCVGLPQTINCAPIPDQSITAGDIILNATATSGLPVSTYLLEGPAVIFGNKIVSSGFPGQVTIRVTQGGNEVYRLAEPIERSFNFILPSNESCAAEGKITRDIWNGGGRKTLNDIPVNASPSQSTTLNNFQVTSFRSANDAQRIRGFICPPKTGLYTFWIASEEDSQLWLSTNSNPSIKKLIANVKGSTQPNQWNKYASQQSSAILLVAGTQYYIESLMNGGGHLSAGWKMPDNSLDRPISSAFLSTFKGKQDQLISFFGIPDKLTTAAAFTIGASSSSGLPVSFNVVSGPATVSGTTITLTEEEGIVTVQASQVGNDQYNAAPSVQRRFEVQIPPTVPGVVINQPQNGSSFREKTLTVRYTLSGNLQFHDANHLLVSLDNQPAIDVHNLSGTYTLYNLSEGPHSIKIQIADGNHRPFANAEATAIVNFTIVESEIEQTINFYPIANKLTTDIPFVISANATSGLSVQLSLQSGPASMNGNVITLSGQPGEVVIKASQNGNEAYKPATDVWQSFMVSSPVVEQLNQTISFPIIPNKYTTDSPFTLNATASSGLPISYTMDSGPATINGNVVTLAGNTGIVIIRAHQGGNEQYKKAVAVGRSFTVLPAAKQNQLISFPSIGDKLTTATPFAISATATSGLPVSFSVHSGPASMNGNIISLTGNAGQVVIRASQSGNSQYAAAPNVDRPFDVKPVEEETGGPKEYCTLTSNFPWQEWIGRVTFGDLDNSSGKDVYKFYQQPMATFNRGETYELEVAPAFSWEQWDEYIKIWIDYNQDGDFEDGGEEVANGVNRAGIPQQTINALLADIRISENAKLGKTRMRVAMQRGRYAASCGTIAEGEVEDYLIQINTGSSTDPPEEQQNQNIIFPAIPDQLTTATPFTLSATATSGLPITYNVISGPASINGSIIMLSGTEGTVVVNAQQLGDAQFFPAQSMNRAFKVVAPNDNDEGTDAPTNYCAAKGNAPWQEWIEKMEIGTIDQTSYKDGYGNFTNISTNLNKGNSYSISVRPGFSWTQWDEHIRVWVDFNKNGRFDDIGELVLSGISSASTAQTFPQVVTGTVTIPATAKSGKTRMRVAMQRAEYTAPCGNFEFGEVEDYTINITSNASNRASELLTFSAYSDRSQAVELEWISNGDANAKKYEIERSEDNFFFYPIKELSSESAESTPNFYYSKDIAPLKGLTYYRIKQIDEDGAFKYSNTAAVNRAFGLTEFYLYPNPVKDLVHLNLKSFLGKAVHISIYNSYGQLIKETTLKQIQSPTISFDLANQQNGMYYLYIKPKDKKAIGRKFLLARPY